MHRARSASNASYRLPVRSGAPEAATRSPTTHVFSIGHSRHPIEKFLPLLTEHRIDVLADVRSRPYSRFSPHFNRRALEAALAGVGIEYLYLGDGLGGRPAYPGLYDEQGHVLYDRIAETERFQDDLRRLEDVIRRRRVAVMCSEEDPAACHRSLLIAPVLAQRGVTMRHIRGDGRCYTAATTT